MQPLPSRLQGFEVTFDWRGPRLVTKLDGKQVGQLLLSMPLFGRGSTLAAALLVALCMARQRSKWHLVLPAVSPCAATVPPWPDMSAPQPANHKHVHTLSLPAGQVGSITNRQLARALLEIYIGRDPASRPAKESIGQGLADIVLG